MGDLCGHFNTFKELGLEVINHRQQWGQTITSILTPLIGEEYSFSVGVFITFFDLACRDEWSNASPSVCPSEWPLDDTDRHDDDDDEEEEEVDWCCSSLIQRGGSVGVIVLVGLNMFCACFVYVQTTGKLWSNPDWSLTWGRRFDSLQFHVQGESCV